MVVSLRSQNPYAAFSPFILYCIILYYVMLCCMILHYHIALHDTMQANVLHLAELGRPPRHYCHPHISAINSYYYY